MNLVSVKLNGKPLINVQPTALRIGNSIVPLENIRRIDIEASQLEGKRVWLIEGSNDREITGITSLVITRDPISLYEKPPKIFDFLPIDWEDLERFATKPFLPINPDKPDKHDPPS